MGLFPFWNQVKIYIIITRFTKVSWKHLLLLMICINFDGLCGGILIWKKSKRFNLWPYLATILMALNTANSFVHRCLVRLTDHKEGSKNPYRVLSNDPSYTKITYSFVVCTHTTKLYPLEMVELIRKISL